MYKAGISLLVWLAAAFLASSPVVSAQSYSVTDLKTLAPCYWTTPYGLNESSQVVGSSESNPNGSEYAFLWTPGKGLENLGAGYATAINSKGDTAGIAFLSQQVAFLWKHDGTTQDLGTLGGGYSYAYAINSDDWIVGFSAISSGSSAPAFLWTPDGGMQNLGTLGGEQGFAVADGINDSGSVVGYAQKTGQNFYDAFSWTQGGGMKNIGEGFAYAINASGLIAGEAHSSSHALLWKPGGGTTDLGTLGGSTSAAYALNDLGAVVGVSGTTAGASHAFVWTAKGGMQDLNTLIPVSFQSKWTLISGNAINNAGQIAVLVVPASGSQVSHALLLSPLMKVTETSSVNPSVVGQAVTFIATITSIVGAPPNGEKVSFKNAQNVVVGTGTISGGVAQFTTSSLTEGTHYITAVYAGDVNYASARSAAITQVVNK